MLLAFSIHTNIYVFMYVNLVEYKIGGIRVMLRN